MAGLLFGAIGAYFFITNLVSIKETPTEKLGVTQEKYNNLENDYKTLESSYEELLEEHQTLESSYEDLLNEFQKLNQSYYTFIAPKPPEFNIFNIKIDIKPIRMTCQLQNIGGERATNISLILQVKAKFQGLEIHENNTVLPYVWLVGEYHYAKLESGEVCLLPIVECKPLRYPTPEDKFRVDYMSYSYSTSSIILESYGEINCAEGVKQTFSNIN